MIVVDTSVIASLVLPTGHHTQAAMGLLGSDRDWAAPLLWRSELCNILATGVRNGWVAADQASEALATAEELMEGNDYAVPAAEVLRAAIASGCSAYDAELVVLARDLGVKLVTLDQAILKAFPAIVISLHTFAASSTT